MSQSNEYLSYIRSPEWYKKSAGAIAKTGKRCVMFPWLTATDAHHLTYRNLGSEIYIRDIIPLSRCAHDLIHNSVLSLLVWQGGGKKGTAPLRVPFNYILRVLAIALTLWTIAEPIVRILIALVGITTGKKKVRKPIKKNGFR